MTGSTDEGRPGPDTPPGDREPTVPGGRCPRCDRALSGQVCLHCAGEDEFGDATLVRRFVGFPDLYSTDLSKQSWPDPGQGEWPAPGQGKWPDPGQGEWPAPGQGEWPASRDDLPTPLPRPADGEDPAAPAVHGEKLDAGPDVAPTASGRQLFDLAGSGPPAALTKVLIAGGAILLAAAVGIVGAVVAGPVANGPPGARASSATPSPESVPGTTTPLPAPPTRAVTGALVQGFLCLDDYAGGTDSGNPIQLWQCENNGAQRWTFATDGTVRVFDKCLRPVRGAAAYGTTLELWDCDRSASQQWLHGPDETLVHPASGACLEDPGPGDVPGSRPQLAACRNGPDQRWNLP